MHCRILQVSAAVAGWVTVSAAVAGPTLEYRLTGSFSGTGDDVRLDDTSFIIAGTSFGTNGSQDFAPPGPIEVTRSEVFVTEYNDIRTFGYFGLLSSYDGDSEPISRQFFVAAQPGTAAGQSFEDLFEAYLNDHPTITSLASFITMIDNGPDYPTDGAGLDWIDFNGDVAGDRFGFTAGAVLTTFQPGETLDLVVFDNTTGTGSVFGTLAVEAIETPEPAAIALLAPAVYLTGRRRRAMRH